jgi:hypothetical protein
MVAIAMFAIAGVQSPKSASAAPVGAAQNLSFGSQQCQADGTVTVRLGWSPSGLGSQYVDLALNANFSNFSTGGPYASSTDAVDLVQLKQGTTYYARVRTAVGGGFLTSDIVSITASCTGGGGGGGAITKPTGLNAVNQPGGSVRFDWNPGQNNIWYCLDVAPSLNALLSVNPARGWRNYGCWTTQSALTVDGLPCGATLYWLVYTWNANSNVKSDPQVHQTRSCQTTISAPTDLQATRLADGVRFDWTAGAGNIWYCVDTAPTAEALVNVNPAQGWRNHGCWNTSTQLTVNTLDCSQTYYWLVYAWNTVANTKSAVSTVQTQACKSELELAPIVDVDVDKLGNSYHANIVAALPNGCHEPDSHQVQRIGNRIEITVWNEVDSARACTFIYREYELSINLGSNFVHGQTYTVEVNDDESVTFIAD